MSDRFDSGTNELFTIVIPTLNRSEPLKGAITSALNSTYSNLQVLVSDNFSDDDTEQVCQSISDQRFRYVKTDRRLGMSNHWDFALNHLQDGYVMFLGDDDAILPDAVSYLMTKLKLFGVECASCQGYVRFLWPDDELQENGTLYMRFYGGCKVASAENALNRVLKGKDTDFHNLPNLYHGAASIKLLNSLRDADGKFFLGLSPDVYSAIVLSSGVESFLSIDRPLTIAGMSPTSNGKKCLGNTVNREENAKKFIELSQIPCHPQVSIYTRNLQLHYYEHYIKMPVHVARKINTNIKEQICIAMTQINKNNELSDIEKLREIALNNNIAFHELNEVLGDVTLFDFVNRLWKFFSGIFISDTKKIGICNSLDATQYCVRLFELNTFDKYAYLVQSVINRAIIKFTKA